MTKEQAISYIHSLQVFGSKPGLERINALLRRVDDDWVSVPYVHIAGTSGKGSTATILASILRAQGYKVGLFVSPSIQVFEERIQVNFEHIDDASLCALTCELKAHAESLNRDEGLQVTEFEFVTALGLLHFTRSHVDIAVIEVGMGGRVDCTNVITPLVSVITPISLDHTEILGHTVGLVAREKAGIIKPGVPVVTAADQHPDALAVIRETAGQQGSMLIQPDIPELTVLDKRLDGSRFVYRGGEYTINLPGEHQVRNAHMALTAAQTLNGFPVGAEAIQRGLAEVPCHGRLEVLRTQPLCIIDAAHNRAKIDALAAAIDDLLAGKRLITIFGMSNDKEYEYCTQAIARRSDTLLAFDGFHGRKAAVSAQTIVGIAKEHCPHCEIFNDLPGAIQAGLDIAGSEGVLLVTGSMYFIGDVKKIIESVG